MTRARVAEPLGIPHYVLDYEERFRDAVIDRFRRQLRARARRRCPASPATRRSSSPICSRPRASSAPTALATGHYVRSRAGRRAAARCIAPADLERDQSYFLFATTQEQLDFLRFPLGDLTKAETRAHRRASSGCRSPTSTTARTSASCRTAATPT